MTACLPSPMPIALVGAEFEKGWGRCRLCSCRRPVSQLIKKSAGITECVDTVWCDNAIALQKVIRDEK